MSMGKVTTMTTVPKIIWLQQQPPLLLLPLPKPLLPSLAPLLQLYLQQQVPLPLPQQFLQPQALLPPLSLPRLPHVSYHLYNAMYEVYQNIVTLTRYPTPATKTVSTTPGSCTIPAPSTTTELAPCQTWSLDSCNGNQTTYSSAGYDERKWQTPGKASSDYVSSFQDYRELTGYADITYSSDRTSATVTVNAFTRSCGAVLYSFGGAAATSSNTYKVSAGFTGTLSVVATIPSANATLTLDRN